MKDNLAFDVDSEKHMEIPEVMVKDDSPYSDVTSFAVQLPATDSHVTNVEVSDFGSSSTTFRAEELPMELTTPSRVRLTWNNLNATVSPPRALLKKNPGPKKQILKGVTGFAEPGSLLAIMGSSGAGKSTLLNILTWRNLQKLHVEGEILANGVSLGPDISSISAYVQQDDLFTGELTVKEHLTFSARLRMDGKLSDGTRSKRVEEVMQLMGLKKCQNTPIGTPGRTKTISGGEMKRLSFATELLNKPPILFCDEPTSGLDSYLAKVIVECMRSVAQQGCTVLCTIHQPSSEVFELFDRLLLLALGEVIYHGDASDALHYYETIGHPCPSNYNPADHYIMVASVKPDAEQESKEQISLLHQYYDASSNKKEVLKTIDAYAHDMQEKTALLSSLKKSSRTKQRYRVGFFIQFYACLVRAFKSTYRNPTLTYVKVFQQLFAAVIIGLIYLRPNFLKPYISSDVPAVVGSIFIVIINNTFSCAMGVMNTFPSEIPLFRRDHFNGMYSTAVYFFSKNVAEFPTYILLPLVYTVVVYFMFGLYPSAEKFFIFFALVVLLCHTSVSYGYLVSCVSPNVTVALAIGPALLMPLLLLGGFFIPNESVPDFIGWIKYISWIYYSNELLNVNQWEEVGYLGCPQFRPPDDSSNTVDNSDPCIYEDGKAVLSSFGFHPYLFGRDIGLMFALLVGYRILALAALYYRVRESTR